MFNRSQNGFTLIETLIYTMLVGIVATIIVLVTQSIFYARAKAHTTLILQQNLQYALMRFEDKIHTASAISSPASGSASSLSLTMSDSSKNPTTFALSNGVITIQEGSSAAVALTSDEVTVNVLTFTRVSGIVPGIQIQISGQLPSAPGPFQSTIDLQNFAVIRR